MIVKSDETKQETKEKRPKSVRKILFRVLFTFGILSLIVCGSLLMLQQPIRNSLIAESLNENTIEKHSAKEIQQAIKEAKEKDKKHGEKLYDTGEKVTEPTLENILAMRGEAQQLPVIGGVAIPSVHVNLPIFQGAGNVQMCYGAGTLKPNQTLGYGNYALISHNVHTYNHDQSLLFTQLYKMQKGDVIYLTDKTHLYEYTTVMNRVVAPDRYDVIKDEPLEDFLAHKELSDDGAVLASLSLNERDPNGYVSLVTLVTCYQVGNDTGAKRTIVTGVLTKKLPFSEASKSAKNAFKVKYNQYKW